MYNAKTVPVCYDRKVMQSGVWKRGCGSSVGVGVRPAPASVSASASVSVSVSLSEAESVNLNPLTRGEIVKSTLPDAIKKGPVTRIP